MLRLRTLGGLTIEDENGPLAGAIARKRSLALLALVGMGTEQGMSRDRVLGYLWPESDTERARNNLKQTLFQLRQDLHEDVFARLPGALRLEPHAISVDACDFQAALDRNNPTTAVTIYRGPFLDGFYLPGLVEFEHWTQSERVRLAQRYAGALETLAANATKRNDHWDAAEWWRRLAAHDPMSARYAVGLMRALAQGGDRAAALDHARVYEEMVRGELEAEPDPEVTDLARELRGKFARWRSSPPAKPAVVPPVESGSDPIITVAPVEDPPSEDGHWVKPEAAPAAETVPASPPQVPDSIKSSRRSPAGLLFILLFAVLLGTGAWWWVRGRQPSGSSDLVAVFPFSFSGTPESEYLETGMVDLLSAGLDGAGPLRTVPPSAYQARMPGSSGEAVDAERGRRLARQLGAELYVLGEIVASGPKVQIGATMYERSRKDPVARSSVEGDSDRIFELVDRLAANLIAGRSGAPGQRLSRVAATTTQSLPAFKAYLRGERAFGEGRDAEAIDAFEEAVAVDTAYALAYYRLSDAADRLGRSELARSAAERAHRFRERLGERERRLIEAQHAWRQGQGAEAERLCRSLLADYPDDVEGWLQLGEVLVHGNPLRGRSSREARPALEEVLERDSANGEALIHLARIAYLEGKAAEVERLLQRLVATGQGPDVVETRAFRAFALGDRPGQKRITHLIREDPALIPAVTALEVAVRADDLEGSERFGQWLARESQPPDVRGYGHRMLAQTALARGKWRQARQEAKTAATFDSIPALELLSLFDALSFIPVPQAELTKTREALRRWEPAEQPAAVQHTAAHIGLHRYLRLHRLGLVDIKLGDTTLALQRADALERVGDSTTSRRFARTLAHSIRAHVADAGSRYEEALGQIESAEWEAAASMFASEAYDRYLRAELLQRLGRDEEALGWFGSIAERAAYELVYLAPAHRRQAEIYDRRGQRDLAAQHYRRFIELWSGADPELQPMVQEARERLEAMSEK